MPKEVMVTLIFDGSRLKRQIESLSVTDALSALSLDIGVRILDPKVPGELVAQAYFIGLPGDEG